MPLRFVAPCPGLRPPTIGARSPDRKSRNDRQIQCPRVPRLLERTGLELGRFDLIEIHEAFAAQVQANVLAWERGWKGAPTGPLAWERVNVNGSSIALGHPWAATGGRIVTSLAREMARRDASLGLVSICAAGAMAGAAVLERS